MRFNKIILLATMALSLASCTKENMVVNIHDYSTTSNVTALLDLVSIDYIPAGTFPIYQEGPDAVIEIIY